MFKKGDRVKHPGRPDWDLGQVLEDTDGGKVKVYFAVGGEKQISLSHVRLEKVEGAEARHHLLDNLEAVCRVSVRPSVWRRREGGALQLFRRRPGSDRRCEKDMIDVQSFVWCVRTAP